MIVAEEVQESVHRQMGNMMGERLCFGGVEIRSKRCFGFADGVYALRTDAVRAAGKFISALAVFAAGMQRREDLRLVRLSA